MAQFMTVNHKYTFAGEQCENVYAFVGIGVPITIGSLNELLDDFEANQLPAINGIQVTGVTNDLLTAKFVANPLSVERDISGTGGAIALGDADAVSVDLPLNIRRSVDETYESPSNAPYSGLRPIRRGRFFLSGLPKAYMRGLGFTEGSGVFATAWGDFESGVLVTPSIAGVLCPASVIGYPLPERPPSTTYPFGIPERGYVWANIISVTGIEFTKLNSRDS